MKHCKWLLVSGFLAAPQPAFCYGALYLAVAPVGDASAKVELRIRDGGPREVLVGFDVYRFEVGRRTDTGACADLGDWTAATRLTPTVLPRQTAVSYTYDVVDPDVQSGHLYYYVATPVNGDRTPTEHVDSSWDMFETLHAFQFLSVGRTLIAEATVLAGCDDYLLPCAGSCFTMGSAVQAPCNIRGDGRYYRMYGHMAPWGDGSAIAYVDEVEPLECQTTTAVTPSTWGHIKTLFR